MSIWLAVSCIFLKFSSAILHSKEKRLPNMAIRALRPLERRYEGAISAPVDNYFDGLRCRTRSDLLVNTAKIGLTGHPIDTFAELWRRIVVNGIVLAIRELLMKFIDSHFGQFALSFNAASIRDKKHEQNISTTISKRVH
jgi:hypothetical protein